MMILGPIYTFSKEYLKKYKNHMTHSLGSGDINNFQQKSITFVISRNTDTDCILKHNFYFLTLTESSKVVLIKMVAILIMLVKLATLDLRKIFEIKVMTSEFCYQQDFIK